MFVHGRTHIIFRFVMGIYFFDIMVCITYNFSFYSVNKQIINEIQMFEIMRTI